MLSKITPLILTFNEEANIQRTLARLSWAHDIVVVDSGSTDATLNILRACPHVRIFERAFFSHAEQWNYGLSATGIRTEWVLALDADYVLTEELVDELAALDPPSRVGGYQASFRYCVDGVPLRGGIYPSVTVLYRAAHAKYVQDGHTQRVVVPGDIVSLASPILHDDRKTLAQWLAAQKRYMALETEKLCGTPFMQLKLRDRARRLIVIAPIAMLFYCLFVRGNILSGKAGLFYSIQRATAESILSLMLLRASLCGKHR
jgi:glycosyltransferase involved in cell wall biosynthesis